MSRGEGRVFVCSWKRERETYRVWVRRQPSLAATGASFTEADEALWSAIAEATGDGENQREYQPPAPHDTALDAFLTPALVTVIGDSCIQVKESGEFAGTACATCGFVAGERTDKPLDVRDLESGIDAAFVVIHQKPFATATRYIFSDDFLALLRPAERRGLKFRRVERPPRAKRAFHELMDARVIVSPVAVTGFPGTGGWACLACGNRRFPQYVGFEWPMHWLCTTDLPRRLPSCFALRHGHDLGLCMRAERWREMVGQRGARGILSHEIGVAPPERCDRAPKLLSIADIARELSAGTPRPIKYE